MITGMDKIFMLLMIFPIPIGVFLALTTSDHGGFLLYVSIPITVIVSIVWITTDTETTQQNYPNVKGDSI